MDALFVAEFRGFFFGEGCADLQRFHRNNCATISYRPRLRIAQRYDSKDILELVQKEFGGSLSSRGSKPYPSQAYISKPTITWQITGRSRVIQICDLLLDGPRLPSKKVEQLLLVREACAYNATGKWIGDVGRAYMEEIYQKLRDLKKFS